MIVREGLLICVYEWVTLVYGSYEHVPISYGVVTLLKANGYCRSRETIVEGCLYLKEKSSGNELEL